eukprot:1156421-Pelagomonas_calceolata.AAC.17
MPLLLGGVKRARRSACAVEYKGERYILTTASNVLFSTQRHELLVNVHKCTVRQSPNLHLFVQNMQITLSVRGRDKPFKAHVEHLCVEADLAVLRVVGKPDADAFDELVAPVPLLLQLPHLNDDLQVGSCRGLRYKKNS